MVKKIAVDVGYGYTKALSADGGRVSFPSVIAPEEEDLALNDALGAKRVQQRLTLVRPNGHRDTLLFGSAALVSPGAVRPWASEASQRDGYDQLVYAAVGSLLKPTAIEVVDVDLVVGLPLGVYGAQRDGLRASLHGQEAYVAVDDKVQAKVRFANVLVLPQAAGAYYAAALHPDGSVKAPELLKRPTGVIDIGFRTTDYFVMQRDDEGLRPVKALSGSLDTGISEVYEALRRRAQTLTGHMIDGLRIETAMRQQDGILLDMGRDIDLHGWIAEEAHSTARRIMDELRVAWGKHLAALGSVLLAGGGALVLGGHMKALYPTLRVIEDPVYANASGFLAALEMASQVKR